MRIIAHRANLDGKVKEKENRIEQIKLCIENGFDVEIDMRIVNNEIYLGHDEPEEKITIDFLLQIKEKCWIHCKNFEAITFFYENDQSFNYFWHQEDQYTLTSKGYIWAYPGSKISKGCIAVMPEWNISKEEFKNLRRMPIFGVCTDYPYLFFDKK